MIAFIILQCVCAARVQCIPHMLAPGYGTLCYSLIFVKKAYFEPICGQQLMSVPRRNTCSKVNPQSLITQVCRHNISILDCVIQGEE